MKIGYWIHGRGRGHAARAASVIPRLRQEGHEVLVWAGSDAFAALEGTAQMGWSETVMPNLDGISRIPRRAAEDVVHIRSHRLDVVLSDGDLPSAVAARLLGVPVVALGHSLAFTRCRLPASVPKWRVGMEWLRGGGNALLSDMAVAVHFLPAEPRDTRTLVARTEPFEACEEAGDEGFVLAYFRDGNGAGWLRHLVDQGVRVVCGGRLNEPAPAGVDHRQMDRAEFARMLGSCRAVVASAGSNLITECIMAGKPMLVLHSFWHHEQTMNALLIEEAGLARRALINRPSSQSVSGFLSWVERDQAARLDLEGALPSVAEAVVVAIGSIESRV